MFGLKTSMLQMVLIEVLDWSELPFKKPLFTVAKVSALVSP
jgi:hypothetical protein